jgi:DNA (cytosine-5)-methyltransferase 1
VPKNPYYTPGNTLILSLFPGIDLFGRAFEERGFCVVRGPDLITGGDIRHFNPPNLKFDGILAGSPCQDYSALNRNPGTYSNEMLAEFIRVVRKAGPRWFLFENVARAPRFTVQNYTLQRFELDLCWFSEFGRLRHFVFGALAGQFALDPMKGTPGPIIRGGAVIGNDPRGFRECCDIQGLPRDFDLPDFTLTAKKQAVANGVPLPLGRYLADLILKEVYDEKPKKHPGDRANPTRCKCGCGRIVYGHHQYKSPSCRKRAQRARDARAGIDRG